MRKEVKKPRTLIGYTSKYYIRKNFDIKPYKKGDVSSGYEEIPIFYEPEDEYKVKIRITIQEI